MEHFRIVRFIWISIVIFIAVTESISQNSYCSCRPIDECLNEIRNNFKNSEYIAIFSPCESSNGIKCCTFLHTSANDLFSCASQNTSKEQMKCILHNALKTIHLISPLQTKHFLLIRKLASEILPSSVNSMHLEYIGPTTELKSTESYNSKKIDVDTLQTVQYTTAAMKSQVQSPVADAIYSNDLETNLIDDFPEKIIPSPVEFIKTDVHFSFNPTENEQALRNNIDSNPSAPKQEIYINENKKYSPRVQLINEATNFEKVRIYSQNHQSDASKERLTSMTNIDSTRPDLDINNRGVTEELLEFDKNADETNARYEKQSMVTMSKDVPTTPAVNSFEQKTPSETFLSLDRISTQPINKNTPTNKSEAPRNDGDINVFTIVKRSPPFSENAQKNKQFAIRRKRNSQLLRDSRNKLQGETMSGNHRVFPLIENNTAEITPMLRRDDPLQASTRNKRMTAPIVSQKDILNKNTEEAEYKNNTTQKKNTKPSLQNNQSEVAIKEGRKGSTSENATMKDSVNATLPYVQKKFRFPPKLLPARSKLHKKEHNSISAKYANPNRFSSSHFQHFYEAKENLLSKINNITVEKTKSTRFEFLSEASRAYLSKRKNEKIFKKSEARDYAPDMKTSNVSAVNDSISMNENDSYENSALNLQNASLASNKAASHLNVSSQEIEKSMQTKAVYNNDTESSTPENSSKVSSEEIVQKITDNLKQLSDINRDNAPKYFSTKSPIDNRNETETSSESSNLPVNVADKQMSDADDRWTSRAI